MATYKVYNKTFLNSVRWLFGYTAKEDGFVNCFITEMKALSYKEYATETNAVMLKKQGITVLANAQLVFINCAPDVYTGFEALKPELSAILAVLERLGVVEINNITCVKDNVFAFDKGKLKTYPSEDLIANILFKDSLTTNPIYADSRDGIRVIVTRSFSDTVKEAVMQMLVTVSWGTELSLSATVDKIGEIDKVSYDAWSSFISDGVIKIMEN